MGLYCLLSFHFLHWSVRFQWSALQFLLDKLFLEFVPEKCCSKGCGLVAFFLFFDFFVFESKMDACLFMGGQYQQKSAGQTHSR